jgi:hypothetical protein
LGFGSAPAPGGAGRRCLDAETASPPRPGDPFIKGPIPYAWMASTSWLPGAGLHVGAVCWLLVGWERSAGFELAFEGWTDLGSVRFSACRALNKLELAGLVSVGRTPGRSPIVTSWTSSPGAGLAPLPIRFSQDWLSPTAYAGLCRIPGRRNVQSYRPGLPTPPRSTQRRPLLGVSLAASRQRRLILRTGGSE